MSDNPITASNSALGWALDQVLDLERSVGGNPSGNSRTWYRLTDLDKTCEIINAAERIKLVSLDKRIRTSANAATAAAVSWLPSHLAASIEDRIHISDYIQARCPTGFPWDLVRPEPKSLAILYNFSPFQDTGATVASKRIREFGRSFDVLGCSFHHKKKQDPTIEKIAEPYISTRYFLPLPPSWASWDPFKAFAVRAAHIAESSMQCGAEYSSLYTRAMWAPSIYAGFLFKRAHPDIEWIVEFSDPLSLDVEGKPRGTDVPLDEVSQPMIEWLTSRYENLDSSFTVFSLAEYCAYAMADQIIFTNQNQMTTMLEHVEDSRLVNRIRDVAVVSNHPTLPRSYYSIESPGTQVDPEKLNLAYFGEFYSSRSIREVTSAMRTLPPHLASRVHLHVFTNYIPSSSGNRRPRNFSKKQYDELVQRAYEGVGAEGLEDSVTFHASLPYLKFLATTELFDYLIVNDAASGPHHPVNPYLPSKWSDYAGSSAKTWAFIEGGSVLSSKPAHVKTEIGDVYSARATLWSMIEDKFQEGA